VVTSMSSSLTLMLFGPLGVTPCWFSQACSSRKPRSRVLSMSASVTSKRLNKTGYTGTSLTFHLVGQFAVCVEELDPRQRLLLGGAARLDR